MQLSSRATTLYSPLTQHRMAPGFLNIAEPLGGHHKMAGSNNPTWIDEEQTMSSTQAEPPQDDNMELEEEDDDGK